MNLTEFLLARIGEEEELAASANVDNASWWVDGPGERSGHWWVYATGAKFAERDIAEHIARHDPARVLAECEARRRIAEIHVEGVDGDGVNDWMTGTCMMDDERWPCLTLRFLALPYVSHPDYDESWRP